MTEYGQQGPFSIGDRLLEQYVVTRMLGAGGHAYVYECRDQFLDELLAVKVIPNPPNRGRDLLNRARAEAQILRRLSHPNVVRMHTAAAIGEDMVCLVMEKLDGVTLRHLLALLGRLSLVEAATIVRQIAIGVAAAHELNVVHRDIKPDNVILLPPNNHVKVLDFGIAKFLGHGLQTSNKYRFQGTPLYMSPEHLKGSGVTPRSDVYQLGTVLFELIAGTNPNLIDLANPGFEQVAFVQITRPAPSLLALVPNLPLELDDLVQRATAKIPEERFASMLEFVEHLDRLMQRYCANYPAEAQRIRYVDAELTRAARELSAREADRCWNAPADAFAPTQPQQQSTAPFEVATLPPRPAAAQADENQPRTGRMASYHRIPEARGAERLAIPQAPRIPTSMAPATSPSGSTLSIGFVVAALGFGALVGVLLLWLMHRGDGNRPPPESTAVSQVTTAAAPADPPELQDSAEILAARPSAAPPPHYISGDPPRQPTVVPPTPAAAIASATLPAATMPPVRSDSTAGQPTDALEPTTIRPSKSRALTGRLDEDDSENPE